MNFDICFLRNTNKNNIVEDVVHKGFKTIFHDPFLIMKYYLQYGRTIKICINDNAEKKGCQ